MWTMNWISRRRIFFLLAGLLFGPSVWAGAALAQEQAATVNAVIDTERFRLSGAFDSWVVLEGTGLGEPWQLDGSLWVHASGRPVVFTSDGELGEPVVPGRVGGVVHVGFNIGRRVRLSLDMPMTLYQDGVDPRGTGDLPSGGVGDLRFTPMVQLLDSRKYWLGLALSTPLSFPTGNKDGFLGESGPTVHPRVSAEKVFSFTPRRWLSFAVGVDLGWRFRPRTQLLDLDSAGEFTFGVGVRWEPGDIVSVGTEVVAALGAGANARHGEWLTWVRLSPGKTRNYRVVGGVGVGLGRGVGTPEGRGYLAIQGTLGLKRRIVGGDAGAYDRDFEPPALVLAEEPDHGSPPRRLHSGTWGLLLLKRNQRIDIQVPFAVDAASVSEASRGDLTALAAWIRNHPEAGPVQIRGHTAVEEGDPARQATLSKARAEAVIAILLQQGVAEERIGILAMDRQIRPVLAADATVEEIAAASRRVDFRFVDKLPE